MLQEFKLNSMSLKMFQIPFDGCLIKSNTCYNAYFKINFLITEKENKRFKKTFKRESEEERLK